MEVWTKPLRSTRSIVTNRAADRTTGGVLVYE
jgi:hypothetical protein